MPAITFGDLTHTSSANTVWDLRVGQFVYAQDNQPSSGLTTIASRSDSVTGLVSGAPPSFGTVTISRATIKTTISHFQTGLLGADHQWKLGGQAERGYHHGVTVIPTGVRFVDNNGRPSQAISGAPSHIGGMFVTAAAFASDAVTIGQHLTLNAGVRFDHARAISQDLNAIDGEAHETAGTVRGLGTLYTWNLLSPRLGATAKLTADGRTMLRGSYGRFYQGVQTGELEPVHPGASPMTTITLDPLTGTATGVPVVVDSKFNLRIDPATRAPHTDEYSIGVDRQIASRLAGSIAYIHKDGAGFIGWTDTAGQYREETRTLSDGRSLTVFALDTSVTQISARRFLLTNPAGYSLSYNGLVMALEKRRSRGWQASGSYTFSSAVGLLPSSGTSAAGAQVSTVAPAPPLTFGRDPNDLINARGKLANDRPHVLRAMSAYDVPRIGVAVAGNFQYFSGKPWAATALVPLPQTNNQPTQRVLLEPRGSRRLSSQSLLDLRVSKILPLGAAGRVELMADVLNALNDTAEEALASDNLFSVTLGQPLVFMDPRRLMFSARLNLGH